MRSALLAGLVFSASAFGTTYQVGAGKQFAQLAQANAVAGPGDIVEVDGNATYNAVHWTASGTVAAPITIRGVKVNGARPHLAGGTNTIEMEGSHVVVEGFELTGGTSRCFFHHADDVTLRDSVVHDCPLQGILGADQDSGSLTLEYVEVHHCGSGTQNHQIYMATDEVAHPGAIFHMRFCYLHDANGGNNVKSRAERNEIFYNWIEGATYHELELIGPDPEGAQSSWTEALKREDSDVVGNVLRKTQTTFVVRFGGDGTGASKGRFRFVNNTVITASGGSAVFRLFSGIESVEMHNNVFVAAAGTVNLVRAATDEVEWVSGQRISGTNNWVQTGATNAPTEWAGTVTGASPGFTSLATYDLRPMTGSPLINMGGPATVGPTGSLFPNPLAAPLFEPPARALIAVGSAVARPVNGVIDIGAYEVGGAAGGGAGGGSAVGGGAASVGGGTASVGGGSASVGGGSEAAGGGSVIATGGGTAATDGGPSGGDTTGGCSCNIGGAPLLLAALAFRRRRKHRDADA